MTTIVADSEPELHAFLAALPSESAVNARSLVHAWQSGGGTAAVGKLTVRLLGGATAPFTAGTLRAPRGDAAHPALELSRVLLEQHGVDWIHWSDEFADLGHHGFDRDARFPSITLDAEISAGEVARLVMGLRDLARLVAGPSA